MIYAIGDIHGQKQMMDHALDLIAQDGGDDAHIVFLGDYTDRGPDSAGVIDALIAGRDAGRNWTIIRGNHDRMFEYFVADGTCHDPAIKSGLSWLNTRLGGPQTLASYGIVPTGPAVFDIDDNGLEILRHLPTQDGDLTLEQLVTAAQKAVPQAHLDFLRDNPLMHRVDDLLFVHAGIRPGVPLDQQAEDDLIWIRDGWLDNSDDHGVLVVHGHTIVDQPTHFGNRIDLDNGAGKGHPLIPAVCDNGEWFILTDAGRAPIHRE
ncbi:serine/threonine protein phosphatase [Loktanella sp. 3ANDIMAR09]|uniref:metallophosphoesterase n=1 Tax=Loktanella sp. 3ANDIMAR09 TaxID=1225657 RepID=UPI000701E606|nr:metallophosphoesterase [Loktanella sp. 3ANDIMAR09]KQI70161.1 serine/threonine protein phosphatase [Loktanella sp. 3ANDIMAR09]